MAWEVHVCNMVQMFLVSVEQSMLKPNPDPYCPIDCALANVYS